MDKRSFILITLIGSTILSSCSYLWEKKIDISSGMGWTETPTPFLPEVLPLPTNSAYSLTPYNDPTSTLDWNQEIWIDPAVPSYLSNYLINSGFQISDDLQNSKFQFISQPSGLSSQITWIYALVAPFPTITDDVNWTDLQTIWRGDNSNAFPGLTIWMPMAP